MSTFAVFLCLSTMLWSGLATAQKVMILQTGFTSGNLYPCHCPSEPRGGLAKRATFIKQLTGDNEQSTKSGREFLLFDSGDILCPYPNRRTDSLAMLAYDIMEYQAIAVGDQDLGQSAEYFREIQKKHGSPFICANLYYNGRLLTEPYRIIKLEKQRLNVGVVGVVERGFAPQPQRPSDTMSAAAGLEVRPPVNALRGIVKKLRSKVDLLVLLSHASPETEKEIAGTCPQFDLILGGCQQTGMNAVDSTGAVPILQTGADAKHVTQCLLEKVNGKWRIAEMKLEGVTSDLTDDPLVAEAVGTEPAPSLTNPPPPPQPQQASLQPSPSVQRPQSPKPSLTIDAFVARDCPDCQNLKKGLFAEMSLQYAPRIRIVYHEIDNPDEYNQLVAFENKCKDFNNKIPAVVIGNTILGGAEEIKLNLDKAIRITLKIK